MEVEIMEMHGEIIDRMEAVCREHGLSLTHQRRVLLGALIQRKDHPSADQIYDDLRKDVKGLSRTTVYRILETFVRVGLIKKISSQQAKARFDADISRHHHITCVQCGEVADLLDPDLNLPNLPADHPSGFRLYDYAITFTGLCLRCQRENSHKEQ
jgi:Fur family peroxide stress response transcriptional regulator